MRYATVPFAIVTLLVTVATPLQAGTPQASCKKIRDAVWAGRTLDQIMKDFDTDAQHVMKCTQKQGRRRATPKQKKAATKSGAKQQKSTAPAVPKTAAGSRPRSSKPSRPSSALYPQPR